MRPIFTDKINSFYHFLFGVLSVKIPIIIPIFVLYQCIDIYEKNIRIDLLEFFIGYLIAFIIIYPEKIYPLQNSTV